MENHEGGKPGVEQSGLATTSECATRMSATHSGKCSHAPAQPWLNCRCTPPFCTQGTEHSQMALATRRLGAHQHTQGQTPPVPDRGDRKKQSELGPPSSKAPLPKRRSVCPGSCCSTKNYKTQEPWVRAGGPGGEPPFLGPVVFI